MRALNWGLALISRFVLYRLQVVICKVTPFETTKGIYEPMQSLLEFLKIPCERKNQNSVKVQKVVDLREQSWNGKRDYHHCIRRHRVSQIVHTKGKSGNGTCKFNTGMMYAWNFARISLRNPPNVLLQGNIIKCLRTPTIIKCCFVTKVVLKVFLEACEFRFKNKAQHKVHFKMRFFA